MNYLKALDLQTALTAHIEGINAFGALTNRPCERYFYRNDRDYRHGRRPAVRCRAERHPLSIRSFAWGSTWTPAPISHHTTIPWSLMPAGNTVCLAFVTAWAFAVVSVLAVSLQDGGPRCKRKQHVQLDLAHVRARCA